MFYENWKKITTDQWVLDIIKDEYKLKFLKIPPFLGIKHTVVSSLKEDLILKEIVLLQKNAIEYVPEREKQSYSTLFPIPKKNRKLRPVINKLRTPESVSRKETLQKVINLAKLGDWAISIDVAVAYLHIPIFPKHCQFLRFCFQKCCYEWKLMCFGLTCAPSILKVNCCSSSTFTYFKNSSCSLCLRYPRSQSSQTLDSTVSDKMCQSCYFTRIFDKSKKKNEFNPKSNNNLTWRSFQSTFGFHLSNRRKTCENITSYGQHS